MVGNTGTTLIDASRALDDGRRDAARAILAGFPVGAHDRAERHLHMALWRRALGLDPLTEEALRVIEATAGNPAGIWSALEPMRLLEREHGAAAAASIVAATLWADVLKADADFFTQLIEVMCRGGHRENVEVAWRQFLGQRRDFAPNTWTLLAVLRLRELQAAADLRAAVFDELQACGRPDLVALADVQIDFIRQAPTGEVCAKALVLREPGHREVIANYLLGAAMAAEDTRTIEETFDQLLPPGPLSGVSRKLMRARAATAEGAWEEALEAAEAVVEPSHAHLVASALTANAKARLGEFDAARRKVDAVLHAPGAPSFLRGRAMLIGAVAANLKAGGAAPDEDRDLTLPVLAGRPLAQALWVGPRLRWVERLSIASYLANGWRYQLYVYDVPENVPARCEVMDAEAILPRARLFREGGSSGMHAGSLGAFSDLFRYALLARRGGMWTDTDVINRRRFEPDGQSFISTELNDAGIYGPNGALMAAPAGSPFMEEAFERASGILDEGRLTFARIGPELIADMIGKNGPGEFRLLPQVFMNPVPWHRASTFLRPWQEVEALPDVAAAHNLHLYTETWRLIGLDTATPPGPETFLGRLYSDLLGGHADQAALAP